MYYSSAVEVGKCCGHRDYLLCGTPILTRVSRGLDAVRMASKVEHWMPKCICYVGTAMLTRINGGFDVVRMASKKVKH